MKIGVIGAAGGMGKAYVPRFASQGHTVFVSDKDNKGLKDAYEGRANIQIMPTNQEVARRSDLLIYSVTPLSSVDEVIKDSVGFVKEGAIVGGFTSVKSREIAAFERYAPSDAQIVSMHPMHGPSLDPSGQTFILIPVRVSSDEPQKKLEQLLKPFGPKIVYLSSASGHDKITADTQVITHFSLFAMAEAWRRLNILPNSHPTYQNPIDDLKSLMAQRLLSQNLSVYTGIAVENPEAKRQISEYIETVNFLVRSSIGARASESKRSQIVVPGYALGRDILTREKIREAEQTLETLLGTELDFKDHTNSHLSLIAKGWTWMALNIDPKANIAFKSPPYEIMSLLTYAAFGKGYERFINNMINNPETQEHDFVFATAVASLGEDLLRGDEDAYMKRLEAARSHFPEEQLVAARQKTDKLISRLAEIQV